jgi:hypothetical protein
LRGSQIAIDSGTLTDAGSLHVSLSDITQLLGTGSVPVVVAVTVFGVFELGEKLASQRAKDALSRWLLSFEVRKAETLPDGTRELFAKIFGERHFSLKCFIRSAVFSLGAMGFIVILLFLISPSGVWTIFRSLNESTFRWLALWLPWSILVDYVSLFKTRFILGLLTQIRRRHTQAGIPHCSSHGLRKASATRLAEAGCSPHQIMAITGHKSLKEVEVYTKAAGQKGLAMSAMARLK